MKPFLLPLLLLLVIFSCKKGQHGEVIATSKLENKVDSIVKPFIDSAKIAGVAIAVYKGDERLLLKSYGYADLEFDVKLPVDASFKIGSVTKQFTAAAILQLAGEGKLSLDDDMTKYVKFDTKEKKVTIRHLLSHTSGIKGFTELPVFQQLGMQKHSRDTLLRIIEKESFDFEPGEALIYNNTGFFILGLIIEKVSGITYEEYVKKNLFDKAGMTHSYYGSESRVVKNQAHGYDTNEKTLVHAGYFDQLWPYAAGSLCSTPEDLIKWNAALHHGKILSDKMYETLLTPEKLNDNTVTRYAKGITVTEVNGRRMIEHSGGIPGFLTENRFFPSENLSIVVLINSTGPVAPGMIADHIDDFIFGKTRSHFEKYKGDLAEFTGTYKGRGRGTDLVVTITKNDSTLLYKRGDDKPKQLNYLNNKSWATGSSTYSFVNNELRIDQTYGYLILKK